MIFVFYFFAAGLILLSFRSFKGGIEYLRFFKCEIAKPAPESTPFATVIAPCRGLDAGLADNLRALTEQDHPGYEVIFVVDDENDAAVPVIQEISSKAAENVNTRLVIASKADGCSQKVENLREGILHASDRSKAFVFIDSDARPASHWLRCLIAPLRDPAVGATTGYRWFISSNPNFASEMLSVWNASIASALGPTTKTNFCWGGSMALRRDVFERLDIRQQWRGTLSDDFTVTRAMNAAQLPIVFVPRALTASFGNCSFRELLEFTTRQMKITRVYARPLWLLSFFGSGLFNTVLISAILITILSSRNDLPVFAAIATLALVSILSAGKSWLRLNAVKLALTTYKTELDRQFWTQNTLWLLAPALFFYNSLAALASTRMTWRGISYELKSPGETVIITD